MRKITRALVSVSDKTGLVEFCTVLNKHGVEILSTGGTAKLLRGAGLPVKDVSQHTGFPEMLDGRVKTLHPKIAGGILYMRTNPEHVAQAQQNGIAPIDMVVCNLYPFEKTVNKPDVSLAEAIENIDIGGPTMVRAAAKNSADVAVIVSPDQYSRIARELDENDCSLSPQTRFELSLVAFRHTAHYDAAISQYMSAVAVEALPPLLWLEYDESESLREGINPTRPAALYFGPYGVAGGTADSSFISGYEPSAADTINLDCAIRAAISVGGNCATIVRNAVLVDAVAASTAAGSLSDLAHSKGACSGVYIGLSCLLDKECAQIISKCFTAVEGIVAPCFDSEALELICSNKSWGMHARILQYSSPDEQLKRALRFRPVEGGLIAETPEVEGPLVEQFSVASNIEPAPQDWVDAAFAWALLPSYKSASVVLVKDRKLVGYSCMEPDIASAVTAAIWRAGKSARGAFAALCEDPSEPVLTAKLYSAGIRGVIMPGGSRIEEAMANVANHHKTVMFTTGRRIVNL